MKNEIFVTKVDGASIIFEVEKIYGKSDRVSQIIKNYKEMLISTYTKVEVEFALKKPEDLSNDFMLKSISDLVKNKSNEDLIKIKIKEILEQFFEATDWSKYQKDSDVNIFVLAKDQQNKQLGIIQFIISDDFKENDIKAGLFATENKSLAKFLLSSIFKIYPNLQRLFLHTRSTNLSLIEKYESWGFSKFNGKLHNWTDLEYLSNRSNILQNCAQNLK